MRARDFLIEGTLTPQEIFGKHLNWRPAALIAKLQANTPFVDSLGPNANEYIPAPGEYERLQPLIDAAMQARLANPNAKIPSLTLKYSNKIAPNSDPDAPEQPGEIPFSKLEKNDFLLEWILVISLINHLMLVQPKKYFLSFIVFYL